MSYTARIIRNSLLILMGLPVIMLIGSLISGDVQVLGAGLIALTIAVIMAFALWVGALVIYFGQHTKTTTGTISEELILDAPEKFEVIVGYRERARAFFLAGLLVLLVGGSLCFGSLAIEPFSLH